MRVAHIIARCDWSVRLVHLIPQFAQGANLSGSPFVLLRDIFHPILRIGCARRRRRSRRRSPPPPPARRWHWRRSMRCSLPTGGRRIPPPRCACSRCWGGIPRRRQARTPPLVTSRPASSSRFLSQSNPTLSAAGSAHPLAGGAAVGCQGGARGCRGGGISAGAPLRRLPAQQRISTVLREEQEPRLLPQVPFCGLRSTGSGAPQCRFALRWSGVRRRDGISGVRCGVRV